MAMNADVSSLLSPSASANNALSASVKDGSLVSKGPVTDVKPNDNMDKDDFLLLLVTQLRYQDPLSPMDNMQFVGQLAQFRQLEGTNNMQNSISELNESFKGTVDAQTNSASTMANTSAVSMIGKTVRLKENSVAYSGVKSDPIPIRVNLGNSSSALVEIKDADGTVIKTIKTGTKQADSSSVVYWDGSTDNGSAAKAGTYDLHIVGSESDPSLYAFVQDVVMGVRFDGTSAKLKIGGKELSIEAIMDVSVGNSADKYSGLSQDSAITLLGKQVHLYVDTVEVPAEGEELVLKANIGTLPRAVLEVVDKTGKVVANLEAVADGDGSATIRWDGIGTNGVSRVANGEYQLRFVDAESSQYAYAYVEGAVDGINTIGGVAMLRVGDRYYSLAQIIEIGQADPRPEEETA